MRGARSSVDFGSRAAFASNETDAAFDQTFRARRTVVGLGSRLKPRQLEAIGFIGGVCSIEAAGVAAAHILVFLPCCSLSEVIFHPDECFCKDPTAPLFRLSKTSSKCQVRQNEPIVGRSRNFRFRSIWAFATHSTNDRYLREGDGWSR